jgi:hypothetical protein
MFPTIPSDNLYKALTYLGGMLIALGYVLPAWEEDRFARDQAAFLKDVNALNVQLEIAKPMENENDKAVTQRRADLEKMIAQGHQSHMVWLADEGKKVETRRWQARIAFWFGWILVVYGYYQWQKKVQTPLDQQLAQQAAQLTPPATSAKSSENQKRNA